MAKYYSLTYSTFATDLAAALTDYYGDGVTIESASGKDVKFSCPQICDKALTLKAIQPWDGAPTVVFKAVFDDVTLQATERYSSTSVVKAIHLVLADNFLLGQVVETKSYSNSILLAKTTNGRFMRLCGLTQQSECTGTCRFTDQTESTPVWFMIPYQKTLRLGKKMPVVKSQFAVNGQVEMNDDGTIAHIDGLYLTGETHSGGFVGLNFFLSHGSIQGKTAEGVYMANAFYIELE